MATISLSYDKNLVDAFIDQDNIIVKDKGKNEVIYKVPFPKDYSFLGITDTRYGKDRPTILLAPYKLEYPRYIPSGYGNVQLLGCGLYGAKKENEKDKDIYYIDTSFLTSKDFEYPSRGKFKINDDEIPPSFWVSAPGPGKGCKASKIEEKVKEFNPDARLIYEEELMSIFAFQDYKCSFMEGVSKETYFSMHTGHLPKFVMEMGNGYSLDNLTIITASRENRKLYREMQHFVLMDSRVSIYKPFWYINRSFTQVDKEEGILNPIYIYSVLEDKTKDDSLHLKRTIK